MTPSSVGVDGVVELEERKVDVELAGTAPGVAEGTAAAGVVGVPSVPPRPATSATVEPDAMAAERSDTPTIVRIRLGRAGVPGVDGACWTVAGVGEPTAVEAATGSGVDAIGRSGSGRMEVDSYMRERSGWVGIFVRIGSS